MYLLINFIIGNKTPQGCGKKQINTATIASQGIYSANYKIISAVNPPARIRDD
jgi:hypothetical protein